jgi:hypothetical protein
LPKKSCNFEEKELAGKRLFLGKMGNRCGIIMSQREALKFNAGIVLDGIEFNG